MKPEQQPSKDRASFPLRFVAHGAGMLMISTSLWVTPGYSSDASISVSLECEVELERISYDDPGTDDEEWIELSILRPPGVRTFADCGIGALELLNGSASTCPSYRRIELADIAVPNNERLVICSASSSLAANFGCDVDEALAGPLPNGWLQNGPDAIRLLGSDPMDVLWTATYGGAGPACADDITLPKDPGGTAIDGVMIDDVLARCGDSFVSLPLTHALPREEARCPDIDPRTVSDAPLLAVPVGVDASAESPESQEHTAAFGRIFDAGTVLSSSPRFIDAAKNLGTGSSQQDRKADRPPSVPELGCAVRATPFSRRRRHGLAVTFAIALTCAAALVVCWRKGGGSTSR